MEICSTRLGIPKLGEHHVPSLRTGRTGVTWAAPTLDWAVVLHQLGRKHRNPVTNPSSRKRDPPEELRFLLSCPLHPCSRGTPGCCDQRPVPPQLGSSTISPHPGGFSRAIPSSSFLWIFLIQVSPQPQPFPGQRVQPRQQSPSPSHARGPSPGAKHREQETSPSAHPALGAFSPLKEVPSLPGPVPIRKKSIFNCRLHPLPGNHLGSTSFLGPAPPEKPFELSFPA